MATLPNTSYVLDSRQKTLGTNNSVAGYNLALGGSPVEVGTYEMLSFNSRNNVYNVDDGNDEIYYDEESGGELGPVLIAHGYYVDEAALIVAVEAALNGGSGTGVYTVTYVALTNLFTVTVATASDFIFTWGTNASQPIANRLLGYSPVDSSVSAVAQTGDVGADLDPHSNLLITIDEESLRNVTLVDGSEYSLIVPLDAPYNEAIDGLKAETFNQTVRFESPMNQLTVRLFTEDGVVLPVLNSAPYVLVIRKVFS